MFEEDSVYYYIRPIIFSFFCIVILINAESCKTPDDDYGECIPLTECRLLLEMMLNKTASSIEFVRKSICGFDGLDSKVCCIPTIHPNRKKINNKHLLTDRKYCGYQHSDDYIHNTSSTSITEFPWMARLVYTSPYSYKKMSFCAGSLISSRYVLTTAYCARPTDYPLTEVQLGEYHITNETDCVLEMATYECSDPVEIYTVEKIIIHPAYKKRLLLNDIALLRLNSEIIFSDYIRPICLPDHDTELTSIGDTVISSGWGFIKYPEKRTQTKKKVFSMTISKKDCTEAYVKFIKIFAITESHLCTRTFENSTTFNCQGDSGAPVIFQNKFQWFQVGIMSNGFSCIYDKPDIHTRVQKYLDWIEENIEP